MSLFGAAPPAAAAIASLQSASQDPTSASSVAVRYVAAQIAGDLNVIVVGWNDSTSRINSITDSKGNPYLTAAGPTTQSGNATQVIYYAQNIAAATAGSNTVTVTFNTTVKFPDVRIVEYSGISTVSALDVAVGASGGSASPNSGSVTSKNANDLLLGANYIGAAFGAVGSGFTQRLLTTPDADLVEDRVVSATGSYSANSTQTPSSWWVMQLVAFRAASAPPGDTTAPTAPSALATSSVTGTTVNLKWTASTDNVGVSKYLIERCQGASCTGFVQIGTSTTATYNDTSLSASTSYSYRVRASDTAGNLSSYSGILAVITSSTADTSAPSAPTTLTATPASSTQINLGWAASSDDVGVTKYLIERCQRAGCTGFAQIGTSTTITYSDMGLSAATSYSYRARASDAAGNLSGYSSIASASTAAGTGGGSGGGSGATIASVQSASQDPTSASSVVVKYAAAQVAGDLNVIVVGWNDSTSRINSIADSKGNPYLIAAGPTTQSANATQVIYYAQNIAAATAGSNTVTVTFNTTVKFPDVRIVEYSGISTGAALDVAVGSSGSSTSLNSGSVATTNDNDLLLGANYIGGGFTAIGSGFTQRLLTTPDADLVEDRIVSATGSYSANSTQTPSSWWVMQLVAFRAASAVTGDTSAPTTPSALATHAVSSTQVPLTWTVSTDNVGVSKYLVERCQGASCSGFVQIGTSTTATYNDTNLAASTAYSYRVRASDAAGNLSGDSNVLSVTTSSASDTNPPTAPTSLVATAGSSSQITLGWSASSDVVGVTNYLVERCQGAGCTGFAQIGTSTTTTYSDPNLSASTSYSYRLRASDAAGNLSPYSSLATAATNAAADLTPPTAPGNLSATASSVAQISLGWAASSDAVAVTGYLIERCAGLNCASFAQIDTSPSNSYLDNNVAAATNYGYRVRATDVATNMSAYSNIANANPSSFGDSSPPTAPANLTASATSSTQIALSWTASTDDVGVTGYLIQRCQGAGCTNFVQFDTSATTAYVDNTAAAATSYSYLVQAMDAAGNMSAPSNGTSAVTSTPPDSKAPTAPLNLTGILFSSAQMNLSWTASTDNVGVTAYLIERCQGVNCTSFAQLDSSATPAYSDLGIVPGTSYSYRVRASDAGGNLSAYSNIFFWSGLSIQAQSNNLADALGNIVQLRGVNISGLEFVAINNGTTAKDPWGGQTGTAVPQWTTIATVWRANAVRLALNEASWLGYTCINSKGVATNPDPWGNYKATVQQSVNSANAAGLYVILDLHWNAPGSTCPQSQVQMADQDHALAFWTSVANTFKGNPAVLFDLFNEPNVGSGTLGYPTGADYWAIWLNGGSTTLLRNINTSTTINTVPWTSVGMNQLIAAVRATGATNVVLIGGLGGAGDLSGWLSHAPTDPLNQLALSWHAYPAATVANEGGYAQAVIGAGIPVIIGETGDKSSNGTTSTPILSSVLAWADVNHASVLPWTWDDWSSTGGSTDLLIKDALGTPTDGEGVNFKAWLATH